ncbi:MAG: hypothetical protein WA144_12175 [Candidatus Methanoperedens sp.]
MKINADVRNIADHMPKIYLIDSKKGVLVKCPISRSPKNKNVRNRNVHGVSPTFQIRRFLYAVKTRINDVHQKRFDRII